MACSWWGPEFLFHFKHFLPARPWCFPKLKATLLPIVGKWSFTPSSQLCFSFDKKACGLKIYHCSVLRCVHVCAYKLSFYPLAPSSSIYSSLPPPPLLSSLGSWSWPWSHDSPTSLLWVLASQACSNTANNDFLEIITLSAEYNTIITIWYPHALKNSFLKYVDHTSFFLLSDFVNLLCSPHTPATKHIQKNLS